MCARHTSRLEFDSIELAETSSDGVSKEALWRAVLLLSLTLLGVVRVHTQSTRKLLTPDMNVGRAGRRMRRVLAAAARRWNLGFPGTAVHRRISVLERLPILRRRS